MGLLTDWTNTNEVEKCITSLFLTNDFNVKAASAPRRENRKDVTFTGSSESKKLLDMEVCNITMKEKISVQVNTEQLQSWVRLLSLHLCKLFQRPRNNYCKQVVMTKYSLWWMESHANQKKTCPSVEIYTSTENSWMVGQGISEKGMLCLKFKKHQWKSHEISECYKWSLTQKSS